MFCAFLLQDKKRELVSAALAEGKEGGGAANRLTMQDLFYLFGNGR